MSKTPITDEAQDKSYELYVQDDYMRAMYAFTKMRELEADVQRLDWLIMQVEEPVIPRFWYANEEDYLAKYRAAIDSALSVGQQAPEA